MASNNHYNSAQLFATISLMMEALIRALELVSTEASRKGPSSYKDIIAWMEWRYELFRIPLFRESRYFHLKITTDLKELILHRISVLARYDFGPFRIPSHTRLKLWGKRLDECRYLLLEEESQDWKKSTRALGGSECDSTPGGETEQFIQKGRWCSYLRLDEAHVEDERRRNAVSFLQSQQQEDETVEEYYKRQVLLYNAWNPKYPYLESCLLLDQFLMGLNDQSLSSKIYDLCPTSASVALREILQLKEDEGRPQDSQPESQDPRASTPTSSILNPADDDSLRVFSSLHLTPIDHRLSQLQSLSLEESINREEEQMSLEISTYLQSENEP